MDLHPWLAPLTGVLAGSILALRGLTFAEAAPTPSPAAPAAPKAVVHVGILLFEGVELLDFAGPAEVFVVAGQGNLYAVHTIAQTKAPLKTMGGVEIVPSHAYGDAPSLDILVVPGGAMRNLTPEGLGWLRVTSTRAKVTMSVCMGAILLAKAGLLEGIEATTHHWGLENLRRLAPTCRVVAGRRFVDAGRIVTTAGVTAGIDGALHLVERFHGIEAATWAAKEWMEHPSAASQP